MEFAVAFPRGGSSSTLSRPNQNLMVLIFVEGGKPENPEKNSRNNQGLAARVISRGRRPRLITLAHTLVIPDITKTEFNYCFIMHCFMRNITIWGKASRFYFCFQYTRRNAPSGRITQNHSSALALLSQRCPVRAARGIICRYLTNIMPQMGTIVFIILQIFFATRAVLKIGEYSRIFPSFSWGIFGHVTRLGQSRVSKKI